jgi:hypothetical protein
MNFQFTQHHHKDDGTKWKKNTEFEAPSIMQMNCLRDEEEGKFLCTQM